MKTVEKLQEQMHENKFGAIQKIIAVFNEQKLPQTHQRDLSMTV